MKNAATLVLVLSGVFLVNLASFAQKKPTKPGVPDTPVTNIVNGNSTTIDQQPWQVYLTAGIGGNGQECGGVIIGPYAILTAAHCVNNYPANEVTVYAGITDKSNLSSGQSHTVSQIIVNSSYDAASLVNDIAILRLSTALNFNANVQAIRYDGGSSVDNTGTAAVASGWGRTCNTCGLPDILQRANLTTVDITTLNQVDYGALNGNMIAAGDNSTGTCDGDSGGPLWVSNGGQNYLIGITSKKPSAGCATNPSIFTRVSSFCSWILEQLSSQAYIVGLGPVCSSANYSVTNQPLNTAINSWSSSNPSALTIDNNGMAIRQNNFNGTAIITATFTNNCSGSGSISLPVTVGVPNAPTSLVVMMGPSENQLCRNQPMGIAVGNTNNPLAQGVTQYNWDFGSWSSDFNYYDNTPLTQARAYLQLTSGSASSQTIAVYAQNACGNSPSYSRTFYAVNCGSFRMSYPNPANDVLTLSFDKSQLVKLPDQIELINEASKKSVYRLASRQISESVSKGDILQIPVKDFARGVYYLHLTRTDDKSIERIRIVLE